MLNVRGFGAAVVSLCLVACSSGGAMPGSPPVGLTQALQAAAQKHKLKAKIRIVIPKHKHHRGHRARYISPATQSIAIAVTPHGGSPVNYNADLTPSTNPNCKASLISPLVCTVTLDLAAGSYTATFATYDGLLAGGNAPSHAPTGNKLSANQNVPLTVANGTANQVSVTLEAIPTSVALVPDASSALSGNTASGFALSKCSTTSQHARRPSTSASSASTRTTTTFSAQVRRYRRWPPTTQPTCRLPHRRHHHPTTSCFVARLRSPRKRFPDRTASLTSPLA